MIHETATTLKPIPNPRGTQTAPTTRPTPPRTPNGRFTPEFNPKPKQVEGYRSAGRSRP